MPHTPIVLGRAALRWLRPAEVVVRRWPNAALPTQWFRLLDEDQPVVVGPCGHFFESEEYEMVREEWGKRCGHCERPGHGVTESSRCLPPQTLILQLSCACAVSHTTAIGLYCTRRPSWSMLVRPSPGRACFKQMRVVTVV